MLKKRQLSNRYKEHKEYYDKNKEKVISDVYKRRKELSDFIKKYKTFCQICKKDDKGCLIFHHINKESKSFIIGRAIHGGYSKERILNELKKCIVLCSSCHSKLHWFLKKHSN